MSGPLLGYAQARIQANWAALPSEAEWRRLAASRSFPAYLEDLRSGPMAPWVEAFSRRSDAHEIEIGLRAQLHEKIDELSDWMPERWRPAVDWTHVLVVLAVLEAVRSGGPPAWLEKDPLLAILAHEGACQTSEPSPLLVAACAWWELRGREPDADPPVLWCDEWRRRWPNRSWTATRHLEELIALAIEHRRAVRTDGQDTWNLRRQLYVRGRVLFRRRLLEPAVALIYLGALMIDLERLRAELVTRVVFAEAA